MCVEPLVSWVLVVCKVFVETRARLVRWVSKVFPVFLDPSGQWESKDPSAQLVLLVLSVFVGSKESKVPQVCVVPPERLAQLVPSVFAERLEVKVSRESKDLLESRATLVPRESRETLAPSDLSDLLVLLESLARTERTAKLVSLVLVEIVALKVCAVLLDLLVPKDSRERRALRAELDPGVSKESKDPRATLVTVDPRDPVEAEPQDPRDLKASKAPRVAPELLDLVPVALLAPWELEANVERWVSKGKREILAHPVPRAPLAATD